MTTTHWKLDPSVQHVRWCNELDFLIKWLSLVRNTSELCIFPIHGENKRFEWLWRRRDCKRQKGRLEDIRNRLRFYIFSHKNVWSLQRTKSKPKTSSKKWNCGQKFVFEQWSFQVVSHIVCSYRRTTTKQIQS